MAESALAQLHDRLLKFQAAFKSLQDENAALKRQVQRLTQDVEELKKDKDAKQDVVEQFEKDRLQIRSRVEAVLKQIATLEEPTGESSL